MPAPSEPLPELLRAVAPEVELPAPLAVDPDVPVDALPEPAPATPLPLAVDPLGDVEPPATPDDEVLPDAPGPEVLPALELDIIAFVRMNDPLLADRLPADVDPLVPTAPPGLPATQPVTVIIPDCEPRLVDDRSV